MQLVAVAMTRDYWSKELLKWSKIAVHTISIKMVIIRNLIRIKATKLMNALKLMQVKL